MIVGTMLSHVGRWRSTSGHQLLTANRCGVTTLPPETNGVTVAIDWPLMWYSGSDDRQRSARVRPCQSATARPAASRFACDSSAPLGTPVVPDVYISSAGSDAALAGKSARARASAG